MLWTWGYIRVKASEIGLVVGVLLDPLLDLSNGDGGINLTNLFECVLETTESSWITIDLLYDTSLVIHYTIRCSFYLTMK